MIDTRRAYTYFTNNYILKPTAQNWFAFDCPFCDFGNNKMNCAVRFDWFVVKCWACDYSEKIDTFIMEIENLTYRELFEFASNLEISKISLSLVKEIDITVRKSDVEFPIGFTSLMDGNTVMGDRARKYISKRGFDIQEMDRMGMGYCIKKSDKDDENYFGYIIIPFKYRNLLNYYIGRDFIGNYLKYKNPAKAVFGVGKNDLLFNEDALDLRKHIFITEGVFDAMTMGKFGVATLGWSMSEVQKSKLMKSNSKVLCFVPDVGFYEQAIKTALPFMGMKEIRVLNLDSYAEIGKDVNEIGGDKILDIFESTKPMTYADAVEAVNKY